MLPAFRETQSDPLASRNFLVELAEGNYDNEVANVRRLLNLIGAVWLPARIASRALGIFMVANRLSAPALGVTPDGHGGFVPISNSRVHPTNGRFIKWTEAGWVYDDFIGGDVT